MAVKRSELTREWLMTGEIYPVPYEQINSDGLWLFLIQCFFALDDTHAVIVTRDGQEIHAKNAHWAENTSRYQRRAYIYVKGSFRMFFIDLCEFDIFHLILESENKPDRLLNFYS